MAGKGKPDLLLRSATFGELLRYLRKRAQLTQRELAIAVGYSEAHISRLERNERLPDVATLAALFVPALGLEDESESLARFLELAAAARGQKYPPGQDLKITHSIEKEVVETFETREIPTNLPLQLTSFIGREGEIEAIEELLQSAGKHRLVTLAGAGGCGKTRLALQVAGRLIHLYADGAWFVDLAPLADPDLVSRTTASALGLAETPEEPITKTLVRFLRGRKILLLLDNCEHLLEAVAQLTEELLHACPQLQILTTTREVLNVAGEKSFHVLPLPYPPEGDIDKGRVADFDSVRLFVQRGKAVQASFDLTDENASYVARVCRHLDGIPLAIELAAARVGLLRVQQIASALQDRFHLLTSGGRTLPRHQTLRAMIDWSHDLLSDEERRLFRRLSVFSGGWTLDAATAVVDGASQTSTLELLSRLVDKSFVIVERQPGTEARYSMLETLREYAFEKLRGAQESTEAGEQHFEYFHQLALHARLYGSEKQFWLDRLEADYDNIRAAVTWALADERPQERNAYIEKATELVLALADFFWHRGLTSEVRQWMDALLVIEMPHSPLRALLLQKSGWYARGSGDFKMADKLLYRALEMAKETGDMNRAAWALMDLGLSARDQGDSRQAISHFSQALSLARESAEPRAIGNCLYFLAESYAGDPGTSMQFWEQGLEIFQTEGDQAHIAWGLEGLAGAAFLSRDLPEALRLHQESLKIKTEVMDKLGIAHAFEGLAQVAAALEEPERAAVLWGAASHLREVMSIPRDPSREEVYSSLIPRTRQQIGDELFDAAWKKGGVMALDEAIEFALHGQPT